MAKNTSNNRIAIKWVRDLSKKKYEKDDKCYICGTSEDLELHHTHSLTLLLNDWAERKNYDISTDEGILAVREEFIAEHQREIYELVYTLCNKHHVKLHSIYGKAPTAASASKQERWLDIQKAKFEGGDAAKEKVATLSTFGKFY